MSVLDLLRARAARGAAGPHEDGASIALVVEGGAMRGVVSAGMVSALDALGYGSAFDAVYGASAGAINAAYFLAGQAALGTTIYHEDINNASFISFARALAGRPIVDLGYLLDEVAVRRKPLDVERVLRHPTPLSVLATDVATGAPRAFGPFTDRTRLFAALRAGATMPVLAGPPIAEAGGRYLDASLSEPIPLATAEDRGHSHVLVLLTRGGAMRDTPSAFDRYFVAPRLRRVSRDLAARYLSRAAPYAAVIRAIDAGIGPAGRAQVFGIRAPGPPVGKLERRADVLAAAARRGYDAVVAALAR